MKTGRLLIRPMREADSRAFTDGIADRALRAAYGFPAEADGDVRLEIFRHFLRLPHAFSVTEKTDGNMAGFLLDVAPELPEDTAAKLAGKGRTLAFAVFPPYQRRGYMQETLEAYIRHLFRDEGAAYIHCGRFPENEPSRRLLEKLGFREYASHTSGNRTIIDGILLNGPFRDGKGENGL